MENKARVIAFYLPQFHPTEVNNKYWGQGFTEWTNVAKAKPLFKGHYQPQIPADLGFYDLRLPEVREEQANLAREYGVEGFCYWHYWFGNGETVLDMPIKEVLKTGKPDFPFCIGWANHSWGNSTWKKNNIFEKDTLFFEQKYLGVDDYTKYFNACLPYFKDSRYICVDGKPLFLIYNPYEIPDVDEFITLWNRLAKENGLKGVYFVGRATSITSKTRFRSRKSILAETEKRYKVLLDKGFDAISSSGLQRAELCNTSYFFRVLFKFLEKKKWDYIPHIYDYMKIVNTMYTEEDKWENVFPQIVPRWDKTPRRGRKATVYKNSTPERFGESIDLVMDYLKDKSDEHKIIFAFAWNEWGEGAYLEPDLKFGRGYLEEIRKRIKG